MIQIQRTQPVLNVSQLPGRAKHVKDDCLFEWPIANFDPMKLNIHGTDRNETRQD